MKEKVKFLLKDGINKFNEFIKIRNDLIDLNFEAVEELDNKTIDDWKG